MPVTRMRMRPWLEKMIESNDVPGLSWVDQEKTMFSIPWKHAARHGWELDKNASLFKLWAIHTGKYVEGQVCDPRTWKANFRCAMNSLPDVEEVKDKSINEGHQAMRVFRLLPTTPKSRDKRSKAEITETMKEGSIVKIEEEDSDTDESNPEDTSTEEEDFSFVAPSEIPDWSMSVEIGGSSVPNQTFCHRFEVSPEHSPDFDETDHIIQICQQLEKDSHWMTSCSLDGTGFLSNAACNSPGSDWSESSSVDELDVMPQYITLGSDPPTEEFWNNFCQQLPPFH